MSKNRNKSMPKTSPTLNNSSAINTDPSEAGKQFEVELCWCIQQLQVALRIGKLSQKQVEDHTKALNTLMNNRTPFVRKRQVMRMSFGDYRSKMAAEEKKLARVNMQVKLSPAKPSAKSVFLKKSGFASSDNNFKFNFDVPKPVDNVEIKTESERVKNDAGSNLYFQPSDNGFRFNFDVVS